MRNGGRIARNGYGGRSYTYGLRGHPAFFYYNIPCSLLYVLAKCERNGGRWRHRGGIIGRRECSYRRRGYIGIAGKLQVERNIGTGGRTLVYFHGDHIIPFHQGIGREVDYLYGIAIVGRIGSCAGGVRNSAGGHIGAEAFHPVNIYHGAVVSFYPQ